MAKKIRMVHYDPNSNNGKPFYLTEIIGGEPLKRIDIKELFQLQKNLEYELVFNSISKEAINNLEKTN